MSNFPNNFDDDTNLPAVNNNITEIGAEAINALRDAVFAIEQNIGLNGQGTTTSLAARLGVSILPNGQINPSAITSLGLVTLPITDSQIDSMAQISESKLRLDHRTQDLFNYIRDLSKDINIALGWIAGTGIKLDPHLVGALYKHTLFHIDVSTEDSDALYNKFRALRDNSNSYALVNDINDELLAHQWADGSPFDNSDLITTNNGSVFSDYYAHPASGIFLNTTRFNNIPQLNDDIQLFAEYIDNQSIFLLGTRIQNLYTAGISRVSRSSNLTTDGYGQFLVPSTPAIAYLKNVNNSSAPVDNIDNGDDVIEFVPSSADQLSNNFDAKFALVKVGDIVRINYGSIEVPYLIKEKKYSGTAGNKKYVVRIAGKNQFYSANASARIDRPLPNANKYGELSISPVNNEFAGIPSLIINNPRGSQALGLGFNPTQFDEKHYLLYLALYPTGFAQDGYIILPGIDVTGNRGTTPGLYTLENIVQNTNNAFRAIGYNYRFTAFAYGGEFGICLADSYNNAAFSIVSVAMQTDGNIDTLATQINLPNNVVDLVPLVGTVANDPLGIGPNGSAVASPPFYAVYGTPVNSIASQNPTKLFVPLRRNSFYVDGTEKERLAREPSQALDGYGDGYWVGTIVDVNNPPGGRTQIIYRIPLDLSASGLKVGKTAVVQPLTGGSIVNFGRFIISDIAFGCSPTSYTDITFYDASHATGNTVSPDIYTINDLGIESAIYFGFDSVSFNAESVTDYSVISPFKRHFEVYINANGESFTHERGRVNISGGNVTVNGVVLRGDPQVNKLDIVKISPKLRGYQFGAVNKITLFINSFSSTTGFFDGYLASYDGVSLTHIGPFTTGKKGQITRFYDETNTDYIEITFDINSSVSSFDLKYLDFQLFPTLSLDDELMLIGTCQVNDTSKVVDKIIDARQFGNTSEKDLSTSVFDYMSIPEKHLHTNGVVRGFDIFNIYNGASSSINLSGGVVLVNGRLLNINNDTISVPIVRESFNSSFYPVNWALCINDKSEYQLIPLLDYDATLATPPTTGRIFNAADFVSTTSYNIPAILFSDLINTRNDLTVLYVFSSVITGTPAIPTITVTSKDARKFVYKKDWGDTLTLVAGTDHGDFRSFESLTFWLKNNSTYNNTVNVKGNFTALPTSMDFSAINKVKFFGDGVSIFNGTSTTIKNAEFNYINFNTNNTINLNNVTLNKGTWNAGNASVTIENSVFSDYTFSSQVLSINPLSSTSTFNNANITVTNTLIAVNAVFNGGTLTINGTSTFTGVKFYNTVINFSGANVTFSGCSFDGCTINYSTSASTTTLSGASNLSTSTINFNVTGNTFNLTGVASQNTFNWLTNSNALNLSSQISIVNNQFNATNGTITTYFLSAANNTNGIISNNKFFRNSNVLLGYIFAPTSPTGVVSIVNNFFDKAYINDLTAATSDQNLVKNLPLTWIYKNNLNTPVTSNIKRISISGTYDIGIEDHIIAVNMTGNLQINLPNIALCPPGRTIIIKDANGNADTYTLTIHRSNPSTEAIENVYSDLEYRNPYGSITLVASIDPNGGGNGSGLTPQYMWIMV